MLAATESTVVCFAESSSGLLQDIDAAKIIDDKNNCSCENDRNEYLIFLVLVLRRPLKIFRCRNHCEIIETIFMFLTIAFVVVKDGVLSKDKNK